MVNKSIPFNKSSVLYNYTNGSVISNYSINLQCLYPFSVVTTSKHIIGDFTNDTTYNI